MCTVALLEHEEKENDGIVRFDMKIDPLTPGKTLVSLDDLSVPKTTTPYSPAQEERRMPLR